MMKEKLMTVKKGLKDAYSLKTPMDSINLYRVWASTYDSDFALKNDYRSPSEVTKYYCQYSKISDVPILDVGAGTGLIGECLRKECLREIDAIDISSEMLTLAKEKKAYSRFIEADLTKKLHISDSQYGAIVSAGTFTHGHVGPDVFDELIRILRPDGLFIVTIHTGVFHSLEFENKLWQLRDQISQPIFHEVNAYGNNIDSEHGNDKVLVTIFRKKIS